MKALQDWPCSQLALTQVLGDPITSGPLGRVEVKSLRPHRKAVSGEHTATFFEQCVRNAWWTTLKDRPVLCISRRRICFARQRFRQVNSIIKSGLGLAVFVQGLKETQRAVLVYKDDLIIFFHFRVS